MNTRSKQQTSPARLFAGWLVLLLYVTAASPIGTGVTTLVGALDREHQLQVTCDESGATVVLHHAAKCAQHRHGIAARVLTLLANSADATNPDHIIHFAAQLAAAKSSQVNAPSPVFSAGVSLLADAGLCAGNSILTVSPAAFSIQLAGPGRAACVRTTVFLI